MTYTDVSLTDIDKILQESWHAFQAYQKYSLRQRADFMRNIATELENLGDELLKVAGEETNLPEARLRNERARTMYQLSSYADACEKGNWLDIRINKLADKPDIRKILVPLGPVVVFGAANFPFAYSTAGGDTASAFAAGCPVIVKAHPEHAGTSELVASAILKAAKNTGMPEGIFAHVHGASFEVGQALVKHPFTKAVGFTGSLKGGKALFDLANQRKEPIPVFAEMSSINPVFLFPEKMKSEATTIAKMYAGSITLGVGQFCTNPGLIIGLAGKPLDGFLKELAKEIENIVPATMLNHGIFKNYRKKKETALTQEGVELVAAAAAKPGENQGTATIAKTTGKVFLENPLLHQEVFGPYSLVIQCTDMDEMQKVASHLEGQLTATCMATENDIRNNDALVSALQQLCGRFILNSVPTGVEVCEAMHHGGPFPATTDARFTSVGPDAIKRFARPLSYQNWDDALLPDELKDGNPLGLWRTVNGELSKD